jgi:hypothetical protein
MKVGGLWNTPEMIMASLGPQVTTSKHIFSGV